MVNTIIFDLDGVIADSEALWDKGQHELFQRKGLVYNKEQIRHLLMGKSLTDSVKLLQKVCGLTGDISDLVKEKKDIMTMLILNELKFVSGCIDFYDKIRVKYKTCIATALDRDLLKLYDDKLGLSKLFNSNIFSIADIGGISKPSPDIFLYAAKQLGSKPEDCVVLEDSPNGVEAAKAAGMWCIGITTSFRRDQISRADMVVNSFSEVDLTRLYLPQHQHQPITITQRITKPSVDTY
ncbi:MAG: HAD family phosphatase [Planctomycetes bacterium]|nr:HAD family phosphatase [Planctomycetota bacterium]